MGTNYYLNEKPPCECCGRPYEALHIGKSSAGWCFSLHIIPDEGLNTLADWVERWSKTDAKITDEYGDAVTPVEMYATITIRGNGVKPRYNFDYRANDAEPGPNELARHRIGGVCVGHGEGTWDLLSGEFS
jgi:hypothetical protein